MSRVFTYQMNTGNTLWKLLHKMPVFNIAEDIPVAAKRNVSRDVGHEMSYRLSHVLRRAPVIQNLLDKTFAKIANIVKN